jgi:hypothetical protein
MFIPVLFNFFSSKTDKKLDRILELLELLVRGAYNMSAELDALTAQVQANTDAEASAALAFTSLAAKIEAGKNDPAALTALASALRTSAATLSAAVIANTAAA